MHNHGYTLLELLCALTLTSLIACLSWGITGKQLDLYYLHHDALLLLHTLEQAQSAACLSQSEVHMLYTNTHLTLYIGKDKHIYRLSHKTTLDFRSFPVNTQHTIIFVPSGFTHFQNGTFTLRSQSGYQQQVIINQAGRAYVKTCDAPCKMLLSMRTGAEKWVST